MKRYYEIDSYATEYNETVELVKTKIKLMKEGLPDSKIDGLYKQAICNIRKDLGIKNVISLSLRTNRETKEQWVRINIYNYELPSEDWNCWTDVKYDEDKKLRYIQMEDDNNE